MILQRDQFLKTGIFGCLHTDEGLIVADTLEHAYLTDEGEFAPKISSGRYECVRGIHQLVGGTPFETFEVMDVLGHSGILFHVGNSNDDSSGCILLGTNIVSGRLVQSVDAFKRFMEILKGEPTFYLEVC